MWICTKDSTHEWAIHVWGGWKHHCTTLIEKDSNGELIFPAELACEELLEAVYVYRSEEDDR